MDQPSSATPYSTLHLGFRNTISLSRSSSILGRPRHVACRTKITIIRSCTTRPISPLKQKLIDKRTSSRCQKCLKFVKPNRDFFTGQDTSSDMNHLMRCKCLNNKTDLLRQTHSLQEQDMTSSQSSVATASKTLNVWTGTERSYIVVQII